MAIKKIKVKEGTIPAWDIGDGTLAAVEPLEPYAKEFLRFLSDPEFKCDRLLGKVSLRGKEFVVDEQNSLFLLGGGLFDPNIGAANTPPECVRAFSIPGLKTLYSDCDKLVQPKQWARPVSVNAYVPSGMTLDDLNFLRSLRKRYGLRYSVAGGGLEIKFRAQRNDFASIVKALKTLEP